jgi:hypothetical protein
MGEWFFVLEGQADSSQAPSAWNHEVNSSVRAGVDNARHNVCHDPGTDSVWLRMMK